MKALIRQGSRSSCPAGYRRRHALQPAATTRGTSGCASCPTATCSRRSAAASASVVTDRIETFTETGIELESGTRARGRRHRHRDRPEPAGARRDDARRRRRAASTLSETVAYKGMMLCGVPNLALAHRLHERVVDAQGRPGQPATSAGCSTTWTRTATRQRHAAAQPDPTVPTEPFLDLASGYVQRAIDKLPKQGAARAVAAAPELHPRRAAACAAARSRTRRWSSRTRRLAVRAPEPVAA